MALSDIIVAVNTAFDGTAFTGLTKTTGAANLYSEGAPPRIVWVPTGVRAAPAEMHGASASGATKGEPRSILTKVHEVDVHLWGSDWTVAEALYDALIVALRNAGVWGSYEVGDARWLGPDGSEVTRLGQALVVPLRFMAPVTMPAPQTVTLTGEQMTAQVGVASNTFGP